MNHRINPAYSIAAALSLAIGIVSAFSLRWVCDDAFITFRYIENFLNGNGLVYNVGERVEGYTHFLWLMIVAAFQWLGANPVPTSEYLGLATFAGVLVLAVVISHHVGKGTYLPLAALMLAFHYDFGIWATSGLETMAFTFLILCSAYLLFVRRMFFWGGFALMLSVLMRPDGALICAVAFVCVVRDGRRAVMKFLLPFLFLVAWLGWKYWYYGDILPNTYYAKSAGLSYFSQGFEYLWTYFEPYKTSCIFLLGLLVLRDRLVQFCLGAIVVYSTLFVARIGGDFMYARFMIPLIPLMYIAGEISVRELLRENRWIWAVFVVLPLIVWAERSPRNALFSAADGSHKETYLDYGGIADEHWYYTSSREGNINRIEHDELFGRKLKMMFEGEYVRVLLRGQDALAYYAKFPECVEENGLTDVYIAHLPVADRGRPGHEKTAPWDYLLARKVHFLFMRKPDEFPPEGEAAFRFMDGWVGALIISADEGLLSRLQRKWPDDFKYHLPSQPLHH